MWGIWVFLENRPSWPKVTTQLSQSGPKVIQSHFHMPNMAPKWTQSNPKVRPNSQMEKQSASQKPVFPVYGPTWVDKLHHSGRKTDNKVI